MDSVSLGVGFFSGNNNQVIHFGQELSHADLYSRGVTPGRDAASA